MTHWENKIVYIEGSVINGGEVVVLEKHCTIYSASRLNHERIEAIGRGEDGLNLLQYVGYTIMSQIEIPGELPAFGPPEPHLRIFTGDEPA